MDNTEDKGVPNPDWIKAPYKTYMRMQEPIHVGAQPLSDNIEVINRVHKCEMFKVACPIVADTAFKVEIK